MCPPAFSFRATLLASLEKTARSLRFDGAAAAACIECCSRAPLLVCILRGPHNLTSTPHNLTSTPLPCSHPAIRAELAQKAVKLQSFFKFEDTTEALAAITAATEGKLGKVRLPVLGSCVRAFRPALLVRCS